MTYRTICAVLEALNVTGQQYGVVLTPLVLSRLPPDLPLEWAREGELHESDIGYLLDFLQRELERRETLHADICDGVCHI